jgi:lipoic acid synthetase
MASGSVKYGQAKCRQAPQAPIRLPGWFTRPIYANSNTRKMTSLLRRLRLHTVCQSARCPNKGECFSKGTATFMILGSVCTRHCHFCAVTAGTPLPVQLDEPERVTQAARAMALRYVVLTSVTRDDLPDGGAKQFAATIRTLRRLSPTPRVEVLTPDFAGNQEALDIVLHEGPDVFNHNIETVPRLYGPLRPEAQYHRSLDLLRWAKARHGTTVTKSGIMVGLGEQPDEVRAVMRDLRRVGCDILTIGQYLSPSSNHYPVKEFIAPETFQRYDRIAREEGFRYVSASPLTRSSYQAADLFRQSTMNTHFQRRTRDEDEHHRQAFRDRSGVGRTHSRTPHDTEEVFR